MLWYPYTREEGQQPEMNHYPDQGGLKKALALDALPRIIANYCLLVTNCQGETTPPLKP
jgi:hypothetical protein